MMVAHQHGDLFEIIDLAQNFIPGDGVAAHFLPLGVGQRPGLAQHGIRHGNLADIVQVGGHVKERRLILAQIHGGDDALNQVMILHQMACIVQRGVRPLCLVCHSRVSLPVVVVSMD